MPLNLRFGAQHAFMFMSLLLNTLCLLINFPVQRLPSALVRTFTTL